MSDGNTGIIFVIREIDSEKVYVGNRKGTIEDVLKYYFNPRNYSENSAISNVIREANYELAKFEIKQIGSYVNNHKGTELKKKFILELDARNPMYGYNITEKREKGI